MNSSPVVLARYASKSNPSKSHEVRRGADGVVYCQCGSWRFQKNSPSNRTCKHVEMWKAETMVGGVSLLDVMGPGPEAVRAPRKPRAAKVLSPRMSAEHSAFEVAKHDTMPCPPPVESDFAEPEWDSRPTSWETVLKNAG